MRYIRLTTMFSLLRQPSSLFPFRPAQQQLEPAFSAIGSESSAAHGFFIFLLRIYSTALAIWWSAYDPNPLLELEELSWGLTKGLRVRSTMSIVLLEAPWPLPSDLASCYRRGSGLGGSSVHGCFESATQIAT